MRCPDLVDAPTSEVYPLWVASRRTFVADREPCRTAGHLALNRSYGGNHMIGLRQDGADNRREGIGLILQDRPAAALDLVNPMGDVTQEAADVLLDLGPGPEAGVGGHLCLDPGLDGLIGVEIRAVGRQSD